MSAERNFNGSSSVILNLKLLLIRIDEVEVELFYVELCGFFLYFCWSLTKTDEDHLHRNNNRRIYSREQEI